MARKKDDSSIGGSWLDTYADMVTLLLTFFIMLYGISTVKEAEWEKVVKSFRSASGRGEVTTKSDDIKVPPIETDKDSGKGPISNQGKGTGDMDFDDLFEYLKSYVKENGMESSVEVNEGKECVYIRFSDVVIFDADSSELRKDSHKLLGFLGDSLKKVESKLLSVVIAGHTAYVDGPYRVSDRRLSGERASSVAIYLQDQKKIDPKKLQAIGHGANYPVATNKTSVGREKNRRVELMILSNDANLSSEEITNYFLKGTFDGKIYPASGGVEDVIIPDVSNRQKTEEKK